MVAQRLFGCLVRKYPNRTDWARRAKFPHPLPPALPARPKLLSEDGNRSGKDNFKLFFGGKFFFQNDPVLTSPARLNVAIITPLGEDLDSTNV